MRTKKAGEAARGGFYLNPRSWEIHLHRKDGEALPGGEADRYLRIPTVSLLALGPAMGFLFVIFLPAIGFALFFREIGRRVAGWFVRMAATAREAKIKTR